MVARTTVLHVSDRFGGGIATVVTQYVKATPHLRHLLLATEDPWPVTGLAEVFDRRVALPAGVRPGLKVLRALIAAEKIDVVHAHSSFAGALVRLQPLPCKIVYTPNAFASLARRGSRAWLLGQAEWVLGRRPITVAAVSADEGMRASRYSRASRVVRLLNLPYEHLTCSAQHGVPLRVVMCGRISGQKDPGFFARSAAIANARGLNMSFTWLGDGDDAGRDLLVTSGVDVTGWRPLNELHELQAAASVYLHSARYEGACLSILDAAALGLPSIGRRTPGVAEVPWMMHVDTPWQAVDRLELLLDPGVWSEWQAKTSDMAKSLTLDQQSRDLYNAYGLEAASEQAVAGE